MGDRRSRGLSRLVAFGAAGWLGVVGAGAASPRLPEPCALKVSFVQGARGPESLLDDVETAMVDRSRREGCLDLASAAAGGGRPASLLLTVELTEPRQDVSYERPLAEAVKPGREPEQAADWEAHFEVRVTWALRIEPSGAEVRTGHFATEARQHAQVIGPDPESYVREVAVDDVAKRTLRGACKGSVESLQKAIDRARSEAVPAR